MEAILGAAGPAMDPRRQVYSAFPATSGDYEQSDEDVDPEPEPKLVRKRRSSRTS